MKWNTIFFVVIFCFGARLMWLNATTQQVTQEAPQSWSIQQALGSYLTSAKSKARQFASGIKAAPGRVVQAARRGYSYLTPENVGIVAKDTAQNVAKLAGAGTLNALASVALVPFSSNLVKSGVSPLAVTAFFGAGTAVLGVVFASMIKFNLYDKVKSRDDKINAIKEILKAQLSDEIMYPTRLSKLHALLKKNEFQFSLEDDVDGIFAEACQQLILDMKLNEESSSDDGELQQKISNLNASLVKFSSLEDKINLLLTPEFKAHMSVFLRLKKQQELEMFEKQQGKSESTFQKTSAAKFYEPMTQDELEQIEQRKKMTDEEWKAYKTQRQTGIKGLTQ